MIDFFEKVIIITLKTNYFHTCISGNPILTDNILVVQLVPAVVNRNPKMFLWNFGSK